MGAQFSDQPTRDAESVAAAAKALGHARGALLAVAISIEEGTANKLSAKNLRKYADECDSTRWGLLRHSDGPEDGA